MDENQLRQHIRDIQDFPQPGIMFRDITPLLADAAAFRSVIDTLAAPFKDRVDVVVAVESRGFIFGAPLAYTLGTGLVPVRKHGKLPWETVEATYELEYGTDSLQVHADALGRGSRVIVHDDVLATGGTAKAKTELVEQLGGEVVGVLFVIELEFLHGRDRLNGYDVQSLITY